MLDAMKIDQSGYSRTTLESARPPDEVAALRIAISPTAAAFASTLTTSGEVGREVQLAAEVFTAWDIVASC
ncbi:MAG: hypothetical protein ABSA58_20785 [Acetobacteraceae bacterium]|jgi:hypothetical protein